MPNQRKKGLKLVGAYLDSEEYQAFVKQCKQSKKNKADAVREAIKKYLEGK